MKNITLSAQDDKIELLRTYADQQGRSVNDLFREWIDTDIVKRQQAARQQYVKGLRQTMDKYQVKLDKTYNRSERNRR